MTFVITESCVDIKDRACIDNCPVDCIYEGARMLYIRADECIDCGACEPVCPQEAIYYDRDLPAELSHFARINAEFFDQAPPDGSADRDHPEIAALPPRSE